MAAELEKLAQRFKENGYIYEANMLTAQAAVFRRGGIPEELLPINGAAEPSLAIPEAKKPLVVYPDLRRKFIEVCATIPMLPVDKRHPVLSEDFAFQLNQQIGQYLPDDMRLEDLRLKRLIKYSPHDPSSDSSIDYHINASLVTKWNDLILNLEHTGFDTIASIRTTPAIEIFERCWEERRETGSSPFHVRDYITRVTKPQATFIRAVFNQPQQS